MCSVGKYAPPAGASPIMGLECAGEVAEVGSSSSPALSQFKVGDRVMALIPGGGYAEYALAHVGSTIRIPDGWSYEEGAACVEVFTTSYQLMRYICKVQSGEVVLIHAGASGIGSAAIQLAHLFGAKAIVTAGTEEKIQYCKQLGGQPLTHRTVQALGKLASPQPDTPVAAHVLTSYSVLCCVVLCRTVQPMPLSTIRTAVGRSR